MTRSTTQRIAAALLALLLLAWMGQTFGAGTLTAAGHAHRGDPVVSSHAGASADHDLEHDHAHHPHPGHALGEHSNLGHMLDHLSGTLFETSFVAVAVAVAGSVQCPPLMSLLTTTHSPLFRPPIVSCCA